MSYFFRPSESINDGARRILIIQLKAAKRRLKVRSNSSLDIHNSRRYFKKIRALLRLIKSNLSNERFQTENILFRDLSRSFAQISDSDASIETMDYLGKIYPYLLQNTDFLTIKQDLKNWSNQLANTQNAEQSTKNVRKMLNQSIKQMSTLPLKDKGLSCVKKSFYLAYLKSYIQYNSIDLYSKDDDFHEWRKSIKQLANYTLLMKKISNGWLNKKTKLYKELGSILGKIQDLSVLCEILQSQREKLNVNPDEVITLCKAQILELKKKTKRIAQWSFALPPKQFIQELKADIQNSFQTKIDHIP